MAKKKEETKKVLDLGKGTGRRKTSVARVYLREGDGKVVINKKSLEEYFTIPLDAEKVTEPFKVTDTVGKYNLVVNVYGGGIHGQADAVRHGVARALLNSNGEFKAALRAAGYLTRDDRMVERKKYGQKSARKHFQFSKR